MNRYMPGMLSAMLVLIVPAFLICTGLAVMAYRKWESSDEEPRPPARTQRRSASGKE